MAGTVTSFCMKNRFHFPKEGNVLFLPSNMTGTQTLYLSISVWLLGILKPNNLLPVHSEEIWLGTKQEPLSVELKGWNASPCKDYSVDLHQCNDRLTLEMSARCSTYPHQPSVDTIHNCCRKEGQEIPKLVCDWMPDGSYKGRGKIDKLKFMSSLEILEKIQVSTVHWNKQRSQLRTVLTAVLNKVVEEDSMSESRLGYM